MISHILSPRHTGHQEVAQADVATRMNISTARIGGGDLDVPLGPQHRAAARVIHSVGSDCAIGKMSVTLELDRAARRRGPVQTRPGRGMPASTPS